MNVLKELKAFQEWWSENYDPDDFEEIQYSEILNEFESNYYTTDEINKAWHAWLKVKSEVIPEGFVLMPKEMSWQKADEIAMDHWNRYQYSNEVQYQGQIASSSSIELARLRWCKNKAHQIMKDYRVMIDMVWEQQID